MKDTKLKKALQKKSHFWAEALFCKQKIWNYKHKNFIHEYDKKLKKYHNLHKDESCIIVGNGPSLTVNDLNSISDFVTFGCNRIYGLFAETKWRPTYYVCQDELILVPNLSDIQIETRECKARFFPINFYEKYTSEFMNAEDNYFFNFDMKPFGTVGLKPFSKKYPSFSLDCEKKIVEGYTVTYAMIQLAIYMGFSEIYLVGLDHSYDVKYNDDGTVDEEDYKKNYVEGLRPSLSNQTNPPRILEMTNSYKKANDIANTYNRKIVNATRGGKLEIFERITLEEVLRRYKC